MTSTLCHKSTTVPQRPLLYHNTHLCTMAPTSTQWNPPLYHDAHLYTITLIFIPWCPPLYHDAHLYTMTPTFVPRHPPLNHDSHHSATLSSTGLFEERKQALFHVQLQLFSIHKTLIAVHKRILFFCSFLSPNTKSVICRGAGKSWIHRGLGLPENRSELREGK